MAGGVWKSSRTLTLMLAGVAVLAGPIGAQAQERPPIDHDIASTGNDNYVGPRARSNRGWGANQPPAPSPAPNTAQQGFPAPREDRRGEWRGRESREQPRAEEAPRWTPSPPPPQAQPALPAAPLPQRDAAPNRAYVDPARDRSYGADGRNQVPRQQGRNGQNWNGQSWNGSGNNGPDRGTDGNGPGYRQNRWQGQNQSQWQGERRPDNDRRWDNNRAPDWSSRQNSWSSRGDRDWSRQWRQDRRYDWQGWRGNHREIYRMSRYLPPYRSYSYRRLGLGVFLDGGFFASRYWIGDPWTYRLPPVYGPYRWVRYYDDAVLVNIYSGEVVDVIYDVFW